MMRSKKSRRREEEGGGGRRREEGGGRAAAAAGGGGGKQLVGAGEDSHTRSVTANWRQRYGLRRRRSLESGCDPKADVRDQEEVGARRGKSKRRVTGGLVGVGGGGGEETSVKVLLGVEERRGLI
eukprot:544766-Hanusia_phi.AAC.1